MRHGLFLSGELAPAGMYVAFLRGSFDEVSADLLAFRRQFRRVKVTKIGLADATAALMPLESPWTTEIVLDCGAWTAYMNNNTQGGDPSAAAPVIGRRLGIDVVTAGHSPSPPGGHGGTQLWLEGPSGEGPLRSIRTIDAVATDGRWSFETWGTVQPFEDEARYTARRICDRFDRPLLVSYLAALGIDVDDPAFYGRGLRIHQKVKWPTRKLTAAEALVELGFDDA